MAATNNITGDSLISRTLSEEGEKNYDAIFGKKKKTNGGYVPPPLIPNGDSPEWNEKRIDVIGQNGNVGYDSDNS